MYSTSSPLPGDLRRVVVPAAPDLSVEFRPPPLVGGRHVLLVGLAQDPDRAAVAMHTTALAEHLGRTAGSVTLHRRAGRRAGRLGRAGDDVVFATGTLTRCLPHVPDLVLAVTPALGGAVAAARIAQRHRTPLVLVVHDLVSARPEGRYGARGLRVAEATERRLLPRARGVAVVNPDLGAVVRALGVPAEHVHLLPQWTAVPAGDGDRAAARRALRWPQRRFTVVHPVLPDRRSDTATVVEAAGLLDGAVDLVLTGEGATRAASQAPPGAAVRVEPAVDDARRRLVLTAADLVLVAERPDQTGPCVPQVLVDCLGAARPVLAAAPPDGAVTAELDRTSGAGLVVRPADPVVLAAAVRGLHLDDDLRAGMGATALRYARARLDRRVAMGRLDRIVEAALAGD